MKKLLAVLCIACLLMGGTALGGTIDYPIIFRENPTTGYEWTYTISDDTILEVADIGYTPFDDKEPMAGAGGTHTWIVSGLQQGEASVTFTDTRSWESDPSDPVTTLTFMIDEEGLPTLVSTEGLPERYMPNMAVVQLKENPTTGYEWTWQADPEGILALDKDFYSEDEPEMEEIGAGGVHTWVFSTAAEGKVMLSFDNARSFEPEEDPAETVLYSYMVDEQLYVTLLSIDGDTHDCMPEAETEME